MIVIRIIVLVEFQRQKLYKQKEFCLLFWLLVVGCWLLVVGSSQLSLPWSVTNDSGWFPAFVVVVPFTLRTEEDCLVDIVV